MEPESTPEADTPVEDVAAEAAGYTIHDFLTRPPEHNRLRRLPILLRLGVAITWRAAPTPFTITAVLQLTNGFAVGAQLLLFRHLLGQLLARGGAPAFSTVLPTVAGLMLVGAVISVAGIFLEGQQRLVAVRVGEYTADRLIETASAVDLITFESPVFHDRLQRAQTSAQARPTQLASGLVGIVGGLFAVGGVAAALLVIQPVLFAVVTIGFIPAWLATNRAGRLIYRFSVEQTERDRRRAYLFGILTRRDEAQEIRGFDLGGFLSDRHRDLYERLIADLREVLRRRLRIAVLGQMATAIVGAAAVGALVWLVTNDRITLAAAGSAAGAMLMLSGRLKDLANNAASLYEGALYLADYASFVDVIPKLEASRSRQPAPASLDVARAEGVTFTYPSRTSPSLVDVDLEVRRGEVVALVGENGSGKTTIAKLLAGLYHPERGVVTWNGMDTSTIDPSSARQQVAVIFQDFIRWQLTAYDNVALGDHTRYDDADAVRRATQAARVDDVLQELENGYETLLAPQFYGGSSISIGQWQRIALARAFFRDAPLVILDEPTAALDPRAEAALFNNMRELFAGRGVLLISHRFGSVRTADRIYVLDKGRVVEQGTHTELMAQRGYYAELFELQARWYLD
jgi:ATP-binding cassette subfamily B protein